METVRCNLCESNDTQLIYDFNPWQVVQCQVCGLVYLNPRPSGEELDRLYTKEYFSGHLTGQYPADDESVRRGINSFKWMLDIIKPFKKSGKVLEIGCATGFFLACAREEGWETWGVELSEYAARYAREELGLNVQTGKVEDAALPENYFDVILMSHVIEHFPDPKGSLTKINLLLKNDGLLVLRVPDISSFDARYYKERWEGLRIPFHLYHFTPKTLRALLAKANFRVIKIDFWVSPIIMDPLLRIASFRRGGKNSAVAVDDTRQDNKAGAERKSSLFRSLRRLAFRGFKYTIGRFLRGRTMTVIAVRGILSEGVIFDSIRYPRGQQPAPGLSIR